MSGRYEAAGGEIGATGTGAQHTTIAGRHTPFRRARVQDLEGLVITEHIAPDTYGLLILAPEVALGSGWLGGDRVMGRAGVRELLTKATRFTEEERQRLTIHLPSRALTLRLDEVERYCGG